MLVFAEELFYVMATDIHIFILNLLKKLKPLETQNGKCFDTKWTSKLDRKFNALSIFPCVGTREGNQPFYWDTVLNKKRRTAEQPSSALRKLQASP